MLFNISASPFHAGKAQFRETMLATRAADASVPVLYVNLVGGQDELVFDGRSVVVSPDGEVVARGASFAEDLVIVDFTPGAKLGATADLAPVLGQEQEVYEAIELGLRDYVRKNGFTDVVLGLSGGIDSSALAAAVSRNGRTRLRSLAVVFPDEPAQSEVDHSRRMATFVGTDHTEIAMSGQEMLRLLPLPPEATRAVKTHHEAHFIRLGIGRAVYAYRLAYGQVPDSLEVLVKADLMPPRYLSDENGKPLRSRRDGDYLVVESTGVEPWTYRWQGLDARR